MEFQALVDVLSEFGIPGLIAAFVILVTVYVAKRAGMVATANQARVANVVMAAIIFGLRNPSSEGALQAVIASLIAALVHVGLEQIHALDRITELPASTPPPKSK